MRALLLPVLLAPLVLLSGCSPAMSGWTGVTVVEGEIVMLVRTCDAGVDQTLLTTAEGTRGAVPSGDRLAEVDTDVDEDEMVSFPTGVMVDDLALGIDYEVSGVSKKTGLDTTYLDWVVFSRADLELLEPGQVRARVNFGSAGEIVDKDTFALDCEE